MNISHYWQSINWLSLLLLPLSFLFKLMSRIRRQCYKLSCFRSNHFSVPIVIVGNITVGGNGKTPLIIYLVNELLSKGYRPGVVSRGYGAINPQLDKGLCISVDISKEAKTQGDEPWMIANKTHCPVVVGRKRSDAVNQLIKQFNCDIILSDDGMQHYGMSRDIEICVIDSSKGFGNGFLLPAGPLREPISRLKEMDYIVYHQTKDPTNLYKHSSLQNVTLSDKNLSMQLSFDKLSSLNSSSPSINLEQLKGKTIHAIAGIASPSRFFNQLKLLGINIIEHPFADHYQYKPCDFEFDDQLVIIMTEKDAVKCTGFNLKNCYYLSVKAELSTDLAVSIIEKLNLA